MITTKTIKTASMNFTKLVCSAVGCFVALSAWAVPARMGGIPVTQPDGSVITVYKHGDEHFHWMTNENGEWIELDQQGMYKVVPALSAEEISARRTTSKRFVHREYAPQAESPLNIAQHGLIILVNFQDEKFETSKAEMDSMLFGQNYQREYTYTLYNEEINIKAQGSARQYFYDASFKQYNPQFDVVGPVTVSNNVKYYGANNSYGQDNNPEEMIYEACQLADEQYDIDFSKYDNDGDGEVDYVYVFYAGFGEADSYGLPHTIWPHAFYLKDGAGYNLEIDGKLINHYACSNEMNYYSGHHNGIGTFVHEFSHVLGLPDLYPTDDGNRNHRTMLDWDVMDYGPYNNDGNTPPTYSGYERFFMGWATPRLLVEGENVELQELISTNEVLMISKSDKHNLIGNDPYPSNFYIIENRQKDRELIWDYHLKGHGMMLTEIKYSFTLWRDNAVNNNRNNMGVNIIEAKRNNSTTSSAASDLFPTGATSYEEIVDHPITLIREKQGVITFQYKEGGTTAIENIGEDETILGIYTLSGQRMPIDSDLPHGVYIVQTDKGSHKIVR